MTEATIPPPADDARPPRTTKAALVQKLLGRRYGATVPEIMAATGWQPHSTRSHLTRLRQKGHVLEKLSRKHGPVAYKLVRSSPAEPLIIGSEERPA